MNINVKIVTTSNHKMNVLLDIWQFAFEQCLNIFCKNCDSFSCSHCPLPRDLRRKIKTERQPFALHFSPRIKSLGRQRILSSKADLLRHQLAQLVTAVGRLLDPTQQWIDSSEEKRITNFPTNLGLPPPPPLKAGSGGRDGNLRSRRSHPPFPRLVKPDYSR